MTLPQMLLEPFLPFIINMVLPGSMGHHLVNTKIDGALQVIPQQALPSHILKAIQKWMTA